MRKLITLMLLMMVIIVGCKKDDPVISEYIVTFNTQGGSNINALKVVEGQKVTKPQDPTKENYIFSGWFKEAGCTTAWDFEKETVMSNVTLYAKWVEAAQACTVTFDSQGGSEISSLTVNKGEKLVKPTDPTKEDCSFLGWYKDAAYTSLWEFATDVVNGDITLYARWSNPSEAVYTVTFDTDGGNEIEVASVKANEKLTMPANPQKLGFRFRGWYSDPEKVTVYDFNAPVTGNITLYAKWMKSNIALVNFNTSALAGTGIQWEATTGILDITNATSVGTLYFDVEGINTVESKVIALYDKQAKSIGGEGKLNDILVVGAPVDNKIIMEVNVPVQQSLKVPLDIEVTINDASNPDDAATIIIQSRPDYAGMGIQPVKMRTTDGKTVFWAPVNVGATSIPTSVPKTGDVTTTCGQLFQWGRKSGVTATNDQDVLNKENYAEKVFPTGEGYISGMPSWDGRFIQSSDSAPNTQKNWLLFESNTDNPNGADMLANAWYQKLWNSGTEEDPIKTESDPCPEGWRVPTTSEWRAIGGGNNVVTKNWDSAKGIMILADAENEQKFVLPAVGNRNETTGASGSQGGSAGYWTSMVQSGSHKAELVYFNSSSMIISANSRALGFSVRCIQE